MGEYAFRGCTKLAKITIGEGVESIGQYAFYDCTALTDVYFMGSQDEWNEINIGLYNNILKNAKLHILCSGVAGDFDGNSALSASDAIYLLYNILYGDEEYPVGQNCDIDNDGEVTSDDATYLLYHILFGDEYPLFPERINPDDEGFGGWIPID